MVLRVILLQVLIIPLGWYLLLTFHEADVRVFRQNTFNSIISARATLTRGIFLGAVLSDMALHSLHFEVKILLSDIEMSQSRISFVTVGTSTTYSP